MFWYGLKGHRAVSTKSQYIVARLMTSGNISDSKVAIPLLRKVRQLIDDQFTKGIFDVGYDYEPIYNASKLVVDRINAQLNELKQVA
ncbi:transposase [Viridibacillus sp. YIM B01967]|uniref:Transposase n=2 Tax=Viridibacillus soli TaxID=2798301 RepID=A0ABS1HCZ9_9BACL|nr:transposase [Viridibacillus soli]